MPASPVLLVAVALAAVSTSGPLIAAIAAPALAIAFWRNAMAAAVLLPVVGVRRRAELGRLHAREWRLALLAGVALALHFATWTVSLTMTSVASATALVATQPVWAALIAGLRGEPVGRSVWLGISVAVAGAALLGGADLVTVSGRALAGDALAVVGGAFAAAYMTVGGAVRQTVSTTTYTGVCYAATAVLLLVACLVGRQSLGGYAGWDWVRLVALTAGAQLLGHSLFNVVLRSIHPTVLSTCILLEIPGAALIAAVFLDQTPSLVVVPAAVLLVAGLGAVIRSSGDGIRAASAPVSVPVE